MSRWFVEMPLLEAAEEVICYARTLACRAAATARSSDAGPVHINFPFREPLIPFGHAVPPVGREGPYVSVAQSPRQPDPADLNQTTGDSYT